MSIVLLQCLDEGMHVKMSAGGDFSETLDMKVSVSQTWLYH